MSKARLTLLGLLIACGANVSSTAEVKPDTKAPVIETSLPDARRGFETRIARAPLDRSSAPEPPPEIFRKVRYPAPPGELVAYLTPDSNDGKRRPAILWITGGDSNTIGDVWSPSPRDDEQTASAYRQAGIVMMFPSLRGGNDNPGASEGFLGEVDDVIAALEFLRKQPHVDPERVYLGGHSTGGTLAMLVGASTELPRAVFAFGPVADVRRYGSEWIPPADADAREVELRSPGSWLHSVKAPMFVIEGADGESNADELRRMQAASKNHRIRFFAVPGVDHFSVLAPVNEVIAAKILKATSAAPLELSLEELTAAAAK